MYIDNSFLYNISWFRLFLKENNNQNFFVSLVYSSEIIFNFLLQFLQNLFGSRDILIKLIMLYAILNIHGYAEASQQGLRNIFIFESTCLDGKKKQHNRKTLTFN